MHFELRVWKFVKILRSNQFCCVTLKATDLSLLEVDLLQSAGKKCLVNVIRLVAR